MTGVTGYRSVTVTPPVTGFRGVTAPVTGPITAGQASNAPGNGPVLEGGTALTCDSTATRQSSTGTAAGQRGTGGDTKTAARRDRGGTDRTQCRPAVLAQLRGSTAMPEDQVPRLNRWKAAHPDWVISPPIDPLRVSVIPQWRAVSPDGEVEVFAYELRGLMDRLEALT